jgi:protein tyrosine kinase modulator
MNETGMARLRGVVRRRMIPVAVTVLGVIGVGAALISRLAPGYKAQAVIRADEVQPAKEYVPPTVAEQLGERLKSLRLSVMARPNVAQAARELDLNRAWPKSTPDQVVDDLRARMDVKLEGEDTFLLTFIDSSPERAQAVVNHVAQAFMQRGVERRQKVATATTEALRAEVAALKPKLDTAERAVRELKTRRYGALPEQQEGNLRTLDQTTLELNILETNLDLDQERRRNLLASAMSPLRHHEETLAGLLYDARTHYTNEHPEVERVRAEYERVRAQRISDERDLLGKVRRSNPELVAVEGEVARLKAMLDALRARQREVRARVEATAKNGQELAGLVATYDGIKDKYGATLARLRDAELAEGVERALADLRFELVEGASLPAHASSPNRPLLLAASVVAALVLGLGLGFALDARDTSIRDAETLRRWAPRPPVLAAVPRVPFSRKPSGPKAEA